MDENPLRLQTCPLGEFKRPTPLVLIHDSGGTTFSYFRLGSLNRDVWAIHDPHFATAEPWKGGFDEIAEHYINLIERAGIRGSILLGGWSLGGYLSLAIAHKLVAVTAPSFTVIGILLIDSPFHIPMCKLPPCGPDPDITGLPELVRKSFDNYDILLDKWELPQWTIPAFQGKTIYFTVVDKSFAVPDGRILHKPLGQDWRDVKTRSFEHGTAISEQSIELPPAVMVRCAWPTPIDTSSKEPCHVDRFRHETLLGWDGNYPNFIKAAIDTDTHHFNIFESPNVKTLTVQLNECFGILDSLQVA